MQIIGCVLSLGCVGEGGGGGVKGGGKGGHLSPGNLPNKVLLLSVIWPEKSHIGALTGTQTHYHPSKLKADTSKMILNGKE